MRPDAQFDLPAPRRILLIKPSALGDVVTAIPVLRGLRRTFPEAHIAWCVASGFAPLIAHDPDLDDVISYDRRHLGRAWRSRTAFAAVRTLLRKLRQGRYDWALDLQGLLRSGVFSLATRAPVRCGFADAREMAPHFYTHTIRAAALHTVDRNVELARALGVDARGEDMTLPLAPGSAATAEALLREHALPPGGFLACVPPTRWGTKLYPERHWRRAVGEMLRHAPVALLGGPDDVDLCARIAEGLPRVANLAGRTSVSDLPAVLAGAGAVVCCDSAAKFIASAVGTPVLVLTGPTRVERTGPYGGGRALEARVACRGCLRRRCAHGTCMATMAPNEVAAQAVQLLNDARTGGCRTSTSGNA